jgi:hypothetical protein
MMSISVRGKWLTSSSSQMSTISSWTIHWVAAEEVLQAWDLDIGVDGHQRFLQILADVVGRWHIMHP